ncbi:MAG TPA: four-carbon acid sugar kinase family protein [Woeseiaceae bacterium]|nr:four-carbon acid sugar kinase family protein [Woeseiaceae bacterium]
MTLRYAFYGDDFTGSTDVLEQLAEGGVDAVLFLHAPSAELLARFPDVDAIGIAGDGRSRPPAWMDDNLPAVYAALQDAAIVHYKTCSTFDSSPRHGSIGRALDIGLERFGAPAAIVVGAPHMGRYVVFGNLFAQAGAEVYRIDRHPTMSRHPVTPMHEADLVRHLALQTRCDIALVSLTALRAGQAVRAFDAAVEAGAAAVLFDGFDLEDLEATGEVLLSRNVRFAVGSSGVTRALVAAWKSRRVPARAPAPADVAEVDRLFVVSGSCSPVTAGQIAKSAGRGFVTERVDVAALLRGETGEEERLRKTALAALGAGRSCVLHSADGPLASDTPPAGERLGEALGRVASDVIRQTGIRRIVFAGGDTSSHGVTQLGVDALRWAAPLEPGAPLVRSHASDATVDGIEMVLKGGQVGGEDFFERVRRGTAPGVPRRRQGAS